MAGGAPVTALKVFSALLAVRALGWIMRWSTPDGELYWAITMVSAFYSVRCLVRGMAWFDGYMLARRALKEREREVARVAVPCWPPAVVRQ